MCKGFHDFVCNEVTRLMHIGECWTYRTLPRMLWHHALSWRLLDGHDKHSSSCLWIVLIEITDWDHYYEQPDWCCCVCHGKALFRTTILRIVRCRRETFKYVRIQILYFMELRTEYSFVTACYTLLSMPWYITIVLFSWDTDKDELYWKYFSYE